MDLGNLTKFSVRIIAKSNNIQVNSRKNDLIGLLKDKLPSGQECLTVFLADEKTDEARRFLKEMRQKLSLADDKLLISYKDEDGELNISQSIKRVLRYIERDSERDRIMRDIERDDELVFKMRKDRFKWIERDSKLASKIEDTVKMIEDTTILLAEDRTDYPLPFLKMKSKRVELRRNFKLIESDAEEESDDEEAKEPVTCGIC